MAFKKGYKLSKDARRRIGEAQRLFRTGRKFGPHSKKWNENISKGLMGHVVSRKTRNKFFKGKKATYSAFHRRVYKKLGLPKKCELCGLDDPKRKYDWANLTGAYHLIKDYKRMCKSCHMKYDYKRRKLNGKRTSSV